MLYVILATVASLAVPQERGLFEAAGLYLFRVAAVKVPDDVKLLGNTTFRAEEVVIGPAHFRNTVCVYEFFTPSTELHAVGGARYSGKYPDFAFPAPKGQSRYWWGTPDGPDKWKTADFRKVVKLMPTQISEFLLKADFKPSSKEATQQKDLADALVRLECKQTRIEQIVLLRELKDSENKYVSLTAERTLKNLFTPAKKTPSEKK